MSSHHDLTRTTLGVLFIGILLSVSFWVLLPFMEAGVWAAMIVIATWPMMLGFQTRLLGKRGLAVTSMIVLLLLLVVVPVSLVIISIVTRADEIAGWIASLSSFIIPPPPAWLERIPLAGSKLTIYWNQFTSGTMKDIAPKVAPYTGKIVNWIVSQGGSAGKMILHFLLTVAISGILYAKGEVAATGIRRFALRLAGSYGENAVILGAKAIRGVALGVVGTAAVQTFLGGTALVVAGVPAAAFLTALMFVLCVAQLGPALILIPVIIWMFHEGMNVAGSVMIVWALFVMTIDNVVRPYLIKRGADIPLLLILCGVIGGLVAFGIIGLFIGPVVLAVTYTLLDAWVSMNDGDDQPSV